MGRQSVVNRSSIGREFVVGRQSAALHRRSSQDARRPSSAVRARRSLSIVICSSNLATECSISNPNWANSTNIGRNRARVRHCRPESDDVAPDLAMKGRIPPGRHKSNLNKLGQTWTSSGRNRSQIGQKVGQIPQSWSVLNSKANLADPQQQIWPALPKFGQDWSDSAQIWPNSLRTDLVHPHRRAMFRQVSSAL